MIYIYIYLLFKYVASLESIRSILPKYSVWFNVIFFSKKWVLIQKNEFKKLSYFFEFSIDLENEMKNILWYSIKKIYIIIERF